MMDPALRLLIRLQFVGWLRFVGAGLKTVRGVLLMTVALVVFVPWMLTVVLMPGVGGMPPESVARYGPGILVLYVVANLVFAPSTHPVYFTPAEVQFLFAGPFSRRQLLLYKVVLSLLVSLPMTLFLGLVVRINRGWPPGILLGLLLISTFMLLFTVALGLVVTALGASLHTRARRLFVALVVLGLGGLAFQAGQAAEWDVRRLFEAALDSTAWQVVSWPLASFFEVMTARSWDALPLPLLVGAGVNAFLLALIFGLDASFLEQSAAGSRALYARIMRARGRQVDVETVKERRKVFTLPAFPHLGGVGPVFWRQLLTGLRSMGRLGLIGLILGSVTVIPVLASGGQRDEQVGALAAIVGSCVWLSIFLPMLVPFDFRGDIDRMATLKALPVVPWRLALGQLLAPTLLLSAAMWAVLAGLAVESPIVREFAGYAAAAVPPLNFYLVAVENVLFLFFPVRVAAATPGDFQAMGRNVLLSFGKLFGLIAGPGAAALLGGLLGALTGSAWAGVAAGCGLVLIEAALLVPLAGWAFTVFDVGRTTPA